LEYACVDHISGVLANLNAVAYLKGASPEDEDPSSNIGNGIA
jgi:hypothetical protein